MTQLSQHPAYLLIEDQLDVIGQKYRVLRILRGFLLWTCLAVGATVLAALTADRVGEGKWAVCLAVAWVGWLVGSAFQWIVRPLLVRPDTVEVARMVEGRVQGLHNGLTNGVLLARAGDLSESPWLPPILEEIVETTRAASLGGAVRMSELRPLGFRLTAVAAPAVLLALLMPARFAHGWQQMFAPGKFVPAVGRTRILDVQPGDVSLVAGQPLEIAVAAEGPRAADAPPDAHLIFDDKLPEATLAAAAPGDGTFHYAYRLDHVDASFKYRVEVGGTQSPWYAVQVVPQVRLQSIDLKITPPAYTRLPARTLSVKAEDVDKTPVTVPQGSLVEVGASIDVPTKKAVLMVNNDEPLDMTGAMGNHRFFREIPVVADATVFVGLVGGEQVIAKLPEQGLVIHCTPDAPPAVAMQWPAQDMSLPPTQDLTIKAQVGDDFGLLSARLLVGVGDAEPAVVPGTEQRFDDAPTNRVLSFPLKLKPEEAKHDGVVTVLIEATDDRDLTSLSKDLGPQTVAGPKITIHFRDPKQIEAEQAQSADALQAKLLEMLKVQEGLRASTVALLPDAAATRPAGAALANVDRDAMAKVHAGQEELRATMRKTAETFDFDARTKIVQKTLLMLALNPGSEAVDLSASIVSEPLAGRQVRQGASMRLKQEAIITTLRDS